MTNGNEDNSLSNKEKEEALDKATLPEREALADKMEEVAEGLENVDPAILSDHQRAALGIENSPAVEDREKEVENKMADSKSKLTGKKPYRDTLRDPAEKARTNPSGGPKMKQGRMFGKKGRKGK